MKFKKPLFLLNPLLLCLSSAVSSFAIDVKTDFDHGRQKITLSSGQEMLIRITGR